MPDFDAKDGLARLPGSAPGGHVDATAMGLALARNLDVVVVLLATAPALALGAPALGYVIAAVAWLAQRALQQLDRRWIRKATQPRTQLGLNLFEAFGRIWLLAGAIILAAVAGGRSDGLTAALAIFACYSVAFVIRVLSGRPEPRPRAGASR
ncbi:MAG TPA: hypothetical protein VGY13_08250 [Solirubrobacteraceae bacterium]|jgi:hypothetical protein|nr:hypothetical protein [Solirubrobacteraceae bacterium]